MKVIRQTPDTLILRLRPWFVWLMGAFLVVSGFSTITIFGKSGSLTCKRRATPMQGTCELKVSGLLGTTRRVFLLNDLQGARLDAHYHKETTYQVRLITTDGEIAFLPFHTSGYRQKQINIDRLQAFLQTPTISSLSIRQDDSGIIYLSIGGFILIGLLFNISWGKIVTCTIDKKQGSLTLKRQGLFGTTSVDYRIRSIIGVDVEAIHGSKGNTYRVSLKLRSGKHIPFTSYYSSGFTEKQQTAECIRNFLEL